MKKRTVRTKFKVGQVVLEKSTGLYRRVLWIDRLTGVSFWYALLCRDGVRTYIHETQLRSLTAREQGNRSGRE